MSMAITGMGAPAPQVTSGASRSASPHQKMSSLFQQIDASGSGSISKSQFTQAFQNANPPAAFKAMGANAVFSKLDPNGTGSVSKQDFVNGMKSMMSQVRAQHQGGSGATDAAQAAAAAQTLSTSTAALNSLGQQASSATKPAGSVVDVQA